MASIHDVMNKLKSNIRLVYILVALTGIGLVVLFLIYRSDLRCLAIHYNDAFQKIELTHTQLFVSNETPKDTINLLRKLVQESINLNRELWGKYDGEVNLIYCHTPTLYAKYGAPIGPGVTRLGMYCIISAKGLETEVISHELCHAQLFNNLGRNWWIYYQRLPSWFDEGLALQFNNRGIYSPESLSTISDYTIEELKEIDRPRSFYVKDYGTLLRHYQGAKKAMEKWLKTHHKEDLTEVLEPLREGHDFYAAFAE